MSWRIVCSPECDEALSQVRHHDELRLIGEAIKQFVKDGTGDVENLGSGRFSIGGPTGRAVFRVDESARTVSVSRFVLDNPLPYAEPLLEVPPPPTER